MMEAKTTAFVGQLNIRKCQLLALCLNNSLTNRGGIYTKACQLIVNK